MGSDQHGCFDFLCGDSQTQTCAFEALVLLTVRRLTSAFEAFRAATQNFPGGCRFSFMARQRVSIIMHNQVKRQPVYTFETKMPYRLPSIRVSYGQENAETPKHRVWRSNHFFNHSTGKVFFSFRPIILTNHSCGNFFFAPAVRYQSFSTNHSSGKIFSPAAGKSIILAGDHSCGTLLYLISVEIVSYLLDHNADPNLSSCALGVC